MMASALQQQYNALYAECKRGASKIARYTTAYETAQENYQQAYRNGSFTATYLSSIAENAQIKVTNATSENAAALEKANSILDIIVKQENKKPSEVIAEAEQAYKASGGDSATEGSSDEAVSDITSNVSKQVVTAQSSGIDASAVTDKVKGITASGASAISNISAAISSAVKTAQSAVSNAAGSASDYATSLFKSKGDSAKDLINAPSKDQGPRLPQTQISTLDPNSSEAIKKPITFKIGDIGKGLTGTTSSAATDGDEAPATGALAKAAKELSGSSSGTSSVKDAIGAVTSNLTSNISKATSSLKSTIASIKQASGSVLEPVKSTLTSVNSNIANALAGARNLTGSALAAVGDVTSGIKGAIGDIADELPGSLGSKLKGITDSSIDQLVGNKLNDILGNATGIIGSLNGIASGGDVMSLIARLTSLRNGDYSGIADANGLGLNHLYGNNQSATVDAIYTLANSICNGVNKDTTYNYAYNKDLYDTLLALAAQYGMSDLIDQLKRCAGGDNAYFDERSIQNLAGLAQDVAGKGDVYTYRSIQNAAGSRNIPNQEDSLRILGANLPVGGKIDSNAKEVYAGVVANAKTSVKDILSTDTGIALSQPIGGNVPVGGEEGEEEEVADADTDTPATPAVNEVTSTKVLDAKYIAFMCAKGNLDIVEEAVSRDTAIATCMAYKLYGGYA